jgi:hypothetical protein
MKLLTLLVVVALGGGNAPAAVRYRREHHLPVPIFRQATISVSRYTATGLHFVATSHGKLKLHVPAGRYFIQALANDTPGQTPIPPCGSSRFPGSFELGHGFTIQIKPGTRRVRLTLECTTK